MALQLSTAYRNTAADAFETTLGTAPLLKFYTGAAPANVAVANSGTLLATLTLPSDWLAAASGGAKTLLGTWQAVSVATGNIGHWRLETSGNTVHAQGTVTVTGGGGDLTVNDITVDIIGQQVTVTAFTFTVGGA